MHDPRYIQVEEDVYIDTKGGLTPQQRAWIVKLITYGIGVLMLGGFIFMVWSFLFDSRENARRASCQSNLKQIGLGIMQYAEDNDTRYPLSKDGDRHYSTNLSGWQPYGWADAIQPYIKSTSLLICPRAPHPHSGNPSKVGFTAYWYNRKLAHASWATVAIPTATFMLGDGMAGNASNSLDAFPTTWERDGTSPLWRHLNGANYAFLDGHVKWLSAKEASYADTVYYHFSLKHP